MIQVCHYGRHGNNLFQHFCGILLSLKHNLKIKNPLDTKLFEFKNDGDFRHDDERSVWLHNDNFLNFYNSKNDTFSFCLADYFQTKDIVDLFWENKKLTIKDTSPENNNLYVHVRLGDLLLEPKKHTSYDFYDDILKQLKFEKGYISSDTPEHEIVTKLIEKYNLKLYDGDTEETIIFASQQKFKVLSLGTFSWWMGFLGKQDNVYFPNPNNYEQWHGDIHNIPHWNLI